MSNSEFQYCKECLYSNLHPLGITFDHNGVCSGCLIHREKNQLNWRDRFKKLKKIVKNYRSKRNNYDCIIPVTGGNDSYFMVHVAKNLLNLNPLLVHYNTYFNTPLGIKNLANLRIKFNADTIFKNVNPKKVKKITKITMMNLQSVYWHCLAGHTVFPVQTSVKMKIPLIIWGEHQGLQQVGMFSHKHEVEMTRRYRKDHDLMGHEAEDLLNSYQNINEEDVYEYFYPEDKEIKENGTRGIYLGNFMRWDPKAQHEMMIKKYNYKTSSFNRTFDTYDYVHCYNYMDVHDLIKIFKHGYSKVTDHATREIRYGRISRSQALKLIINKEKQKIKYDELFCNWLGISKKSFYFILDSFRNQRFWKKIDIGKYKNKIHSQNLIKQTSRQKKNNYYKKSIFIRNARLKLNQKDEYITFGKGI